jgi:ATP-dependent DNA ligase
LVRGNGFAGAVFQYFPAPYSDQGRSSIAPSTERTSSVNSTPLKSFAKTALSRRAAARLLRSERKLIYAGRAGSGINNAELQRLSRRLQPLAADNMPLDRPPPRGSRFASPLVLSRVHWVRPELVAEVKFLAWTEDNLLRQVVYEGLREDKPAR